MAPTELFRSERYNRSIFLEDILAIKIETDSLIKIGAGTVSHLDLRTSNWCVEEIPTQGSGIWHSSGEGVYSCKFLGINMLGVASKLTDRSLNSI